MGIVRKIGGGLGRSAGRIMGIDTIKAGGSMVSGMGRRVFSPRCPMCARGSLIVLDVPVNGETERVRACDACEYFQPLGGPGARELSALKENFEEQYGNLSEERVNGLLKAQKVSFRIYLGVALLAMAYALYCVLFGKSVSILLPASGFGLMFLAMAMKASYRHWQLRTRTFFVPGSFGRWWRTGEWLV